jgi:hypothetical protein
MGRQNRVCVELSDKAYDLIMKLARKLGRSTRDVVKDILEGLTISVSQEEIIAFLDPSEKLRELYEEVKGLKELLKKELSSRSLPTTTVPDVYREFAYQERCLSFVKDLASHGLLTLVKKFLRGEDVKEIYQLVSDDAFYMIDNCRDTILSVNMSESQEVKRLEWVI